MTAVYSNGHSKPTVGREWRASSLVELPSGRCVLTRPADLLTLAMNGSIPDQLSTLVAEMIYESSAPTEQTLTGVERILRVRKAHLPVINAVCRAILQEPKVVDDPQADDEIAIDDLEILDRLHLFERVVQGHRALRSFRDQQGADVAVVSDGQDVQPATEQPDSDPA